MNQRVWVVACLCTLSACFFEASVSNESFIACEASEECPNGWTCRAQVQRCVPQRATDDGPRLVDITITPMVAGPNQSVLIEIVTDRNLATAPSLELSYDGTTASLLPQHYEATTASFHWLTPGDLPAASTAELAVRLMDEWGTEALVSAGSIVLDGEAPVVNSLIWTGGRTVALPTDTISFVAQVSADVISAHGELLDANDNVLMSLQAAAILDESGVIPHVRVTGTIDLAQLELDGAENLRLLLTVLDHVGLQGAAVTSSIRVNSAPPTTMIDSGPPLEATSLRATFAFSSPDDDVVGFECNLNNAGFESCTSPFERQLSHEGPQSFQVRAIDESGLVDLAPPSYQWNETRRWGGVGHVTGRSAISSDGQLYSWGSNASGQLGLGYFDGAAWAPTRVGEERDWTFVSASSVFSCGVRFEGGDSSLWCWGRNNDGQLGVGDYMDRAVPVRLSGKSWVHVNVNFSHACGIQADGSLWCWGDNGHGKLGVGDAEPRLVPTQVGTSLGWLDVRTSNNSTCGIRAEGEQRRAYCWGLLAAGEPAEIRGDAHFTPTRVGLEIDWLDIAPGNQLFCGLRGQAGFATLWCWGRIGDDFDELSPTAFDSRSNFIQLGASGTNAFCAAQAGGSLACWGSFGAGISPDHVQWLYEPTDIAHITDSVDFSLGAALCSISSERVLTCLGGGGSAALGGGEPAIEQVVGGHRFIDLRAKGNASCGLTQEAEGRCWGAGGGGFRMLADRIDYPALIPMAGTVHSLLAFAGNGCALVDPAGAPTESRWMCWGRDIDADYVYTDSPTEVDPSANGDWSTFDFAASSQDGLSYCGIREHAGSNTLWCFGANRRGQLGLGFVSAAGERVNLTQVTGADYTEHWRLISLNRNAACGIREHGELRTLRCWGDNTFGVLATGGGSTISVPTLVGDAPDWQSVGVGEAGACGIRGASDVGTLWCWGNNVNGEVGDGTAVRRTVPTQVSSDTDWTEVVVGQSHRCARKTDGSVWCWGLNNSRQVSPFLSDNKAFTPHLVLLPEPVESIAAGMNHTCAQGQTKAVCWGSGTFGQLGNGITWGPIASDGPL